MKDATIHIYYYRNEILRGWSEVAFYTTIAVDVSLPNDTQCSWTLSMLPSSPHNKPTRPRCHQPAYIVSPSTRGWQKKKHVFSGYKGASRIYRRASPEMRTLSICIILHNHPCITNGYRDDVGSAGWALGRISNAQNISLNACVCVWVRAWLYQHSFGAVCTIRTVIAFASWWTIRVDAIYRIANLCFRIRCHISLLLVACVMFHD